MADINVVADAAGYVIRCNGQQVAWCADGTRADAVADALELLEEDISGQLTQANASLDAQDQVDDEGHRQCLACAWTREEAP